MTLVEKFGFSFHELRQTLQAARVLVIGDVMLDRYWFGEVNRISPEAPVPVARIERFEERAGGAANVARNVASMGGQVTLLSVTGNDEASETLSRLMEEVGVEPRLKQDNSIRTTVKLRVMSRQQQLIRLDFEDIPSHEILAIKLEEYCQIVSDFDVVILSDYGKGGLFHVTRMIEVARALEKSVLVDPKGDDYRQYKGATLLTPNRAELRQVVGSWHGEEDLVNRAHALRAELSLDALLLTRSEEGMTLFSREPIQGKQTLTEPTRAQEVYDVSGAGDTVIASLGLGLAAGLNVTQAMQLANAAAGVVVGKVGTAVCTQEELFALTDH